MIPTLPLAARNRLAETILAARHDPRARHVLERLAAGDPAGPWIGALAPEHEPCLRLRARQALVALDSRPPVGATARSGALAAAAALFDAGLGFEAHAILEPLWAAARGGERDALQGLIQVAVGYQHLANGNVAGARALLAEGTARLGTARLDGLDLEAFATAVRRTGLPPPEGSARPPFPRERPP